MQKTFRPKPRPRWWRNSQISSIMSHDWRTQTERGHTGYEKSKRSFTQVKHLWCFWESMRAMWRAFTAGDLVFIILPVSTLMIESLSLLKRNRLILILTACVTCRNTCLLSFHLFLPHRLAECLLLESIFNLPQRDENIISEVVIILNIQGRKCRVCSAYSACSGYDGFIVTVKLPAHVIKEMFCPRNFHSWLKNNQNYLMKKYLKWRPVYYLYSNISWFMYMFSNIVLKVTLWS